jgi:hypothetical protein
MTPLRLPCVPRPRPRPIVWSVVAYMLLSAPGASASAVNQPAPPTIQSESVSNIVLQGATLEAQVATNGLETAYQLWIECGVGLYQCGSPELVAHGMIQAGTPNQALSASVEGLNYGDRYKYWAVATNPYGPSIGPTRVFQPDEAWPGPLSEAEGATGLAEHEATLTGRIHPTASEPGEFTYFFEYGPTASYGTSAPEQPGATIRFASCGLICASEATEPKPVSVQATGLTPATTYHYRLVATSSGGYRQFGPDASFTTTGQSSLPGEPAETVAGGSTAQGGPTTLLGTTPPLSPTSTTAPALSATVLRSSSAKLLRRALSACHVKHVHRLTCLKRAYGKYGRAARRDRR